MTTAETWQKEQLSLAFLHAVATRAGYTIGSWNVDKDGVDLTLRCQGLLVDLQVKCTSSPTVLASGDFSFQLDTPTYNKLRDRTRSGPGYLALVIAPADPVHWIVHNPEDILLACHGYWARIQDRQAQASGESIAIDIPKTHVLNDMALAQMFKDAVYLVTRGVAA